MTGVDEVSAESLTVLVGRLRRDRRRDPRSGRREYSLAVRAVVSAAERVLAQGTAAERKALVRSLRTAVDRVTVALQYLDDSSGIVGEDLREVMSLYARACRVSPPPVRGLATWLVGVACDGPGWPPVRLADFAEALGSAGLDVVAGLCDERIAAAAVTGPLDRQVDSEREWALRAARRLREQLTELSGDVDRYVAVLAEDLAHAGRYEQIALALHGAGRVEEAIEWARRGVRAHPSSPGNDRLLDLLVAWLAATGDPDGALAARWAEFRRRPIAGTYRSLVATATAIAVEPGTDLDPSQVAHEAGELLRQKTAADPRYAPHLVEVLLDDDRVEQAWDVGRRHRAQLGSHGWLQVLAARAQTCPGQVLDPYRELIEEHLLDSYDTRRYDRALDLLTRLQAAQIAAGDAEGFTAYVTDLRARHKIRPAFLRKLDTWSARHLL